MTMRRKMRKRRRRLRGLLIHKLMVKGKDSRILIKATRLRVDGNVREAIELQPLGQNGLILIRPAIPTKTYLIQCLV